MDDKGILTIGSYIITRNYRISLTHSDNRIFTLIIRGVTEADRGEYMCQVNTVPMISQTGFLDVVVPPDIDESRSSTDVVAAEGSDVSLTCHARGYPSPTINWRREDGEKIPLATAVANYEVSSAAAALATLNLNTSLAARRDAKGKKHVGK